jgi:hypothetical protein
MNGRGTKMKTSITVIHWLPRIICILAILFISLFAADAFEHGVTIWQKLGSFLMHLIPSFILLSFLIIAWKWEFVGGIIFMAIGLGFSPYIFMHNYNMNHSVGLSLAIVTFINMPFVVIGILFLISHSMKKRNLSVSS